MLKRLIKKIVAVGSAVVFILSFSVNTFAYTKLYESRESENVVKGVTYDKGFIYTTEGNVDYSVLKIDLTNPNLSVKPIESVKEPSLKETVQELVKSNGAVAGVNSAYFGLNGNYSASFGAVVRDGELISVGTDKNVSKNEFASFLVDENGESFMEYIKTELEFLNDGESNISFASINKITEMKYPIYFDRNVSDSTRVLDARFKGLTKVVVEDGEITYVSLRGEIVDVPEDGYIIVLPESTSDETIAKFEAGQSAEFNIISNIDFEKIETAISGGGIVLKDGVKPADLGENVTGRNPRTLLGIDKEGKTMILMCIDGKRAGSATSIGATLDEAIELMKAEGCVDVMSLDGGGSTTMAADFGAAGNVELVNNPAQGTQRKVAAAAGVFDSAEDGEIESLVIETSEGRGFYGTKITVNVYGLDENLHKIEIPEEKIENITFDIEGGVWTKYGREFEIRKAGDVTINASYRGAKGTKTVQGLKVSYISPNVRSLTLAKSGSAEISFTMTSVDGYSAPVSGVKMTSDFVKVDGNKVTADKEGSGVIKCELNGLITYVKVGVGTAEKAITSFEGYDKLSFSSYPKTITGEVSPSTAKVNDGGNSVAISYNFAESTATQAAYMDFLEPIKIEGEPVSLKLAIYGDGSGNWIRGKVKDAKGNDHVIDFTRDMSWNGWQDAEAVLPTGIAYPIEFTEVYVAALSNTNLEKQAVYFDNLRGMYGAAEAAEAPVDVRIADSLYKDMSNRMGDSFYITIGGDVVSEAAKNADINLYTDARVAAFNGLNKLTNMMYYGGGSDISRQSDKETVVYDGKYVVYNKPNVTIVQMSAANGGLKSTDLSQWSKFKADIDKADNKNVIFVMDKTPSYFSDENEMKVFRQALGEIKDSGKNVFVVSADGYGYWASAVDGIRYINLPDLWYETGSLNKNYKVLRFEVNGNGIKYDVDNIF